MAYEQDDVEADKIYEAVDEAMDSRRRARRCVLSVFVALPLTHIISLQQRRKRAD